MQDFLWCCCGQCGVSSFSQFLGPAYISQDLQTPSYVVGTNNRVLLYCTYHFQGGSLCFSFCLLVSSVSDFRPDTRRVVVDTFFRLTCSVALWGGRDAQTNNTGVCSRCLSHTGPAPTHDTHALPDHTARNNTRESPRYIFTIFMIILFFSFFFF